MAAQKEKPPIIQAQQILKDRNLFFSLFGGLKVTKVVRLNNEREEDFPCQPDEMEKDSRT